MKVKVFLSGAALSLLVAGCAHDIRHASARRSVDLSGGQSPSGVVEFYSDRNDSVVPIYSIDKNGGVRKVHAVGLDAGGAYDFNRYETEVSKRLIVSTSTGTQQFLIDGEGPLVRVPVSEGKATPVEIHYKLVDSGDVFVTYNADANVLPATEPTPEPKKKK